MTSIGVIKAVSPSQAACKAFNSARRKNATLDTFQFIVESENTRTLKYYEVQKVQINEPTPHEKKFGITFRTIATKVNPFLSVA